MTLGEHQRLLGKYLPYLLIRILSEGYSYRLGYAKRCVSFTVECPGCSRPINYTCPVGGENSNHKRHLALDIDLFRADGTYVVDTEEHRQFGKFWESLHPLLRWGGRFNDGNHYAVFYKGII